MVEKPHYFCRLRVPLDRQRFQKVLAEADCFPLFPSYPGPSTASFDDPPPPPPRAGRRGSRLLTTFTYGAITLTLEP